MQVIQVVCSLVGNVGVNRSSCDGSVKDSLQTVTLLKFLKDDIPGNRANVFIVGEVIFAVSLILILGKFA